jgi:hypothetical protein
MLSFVLLLVILGNHVGWIGHASFALVDWNATWGLTQLPMHIGILITVVTENIVTVL